MFLSYIFFSLILIFYFEKNGTAMAVLAAPLPAALIYDYNSILLYMQAQCVRTSVRTRIYVLACEYRPMCGRVYVHECARVGCSCARVCVH